MRMTFLTGVAFAALMIPGAAYAQSTGSVDFENDIVVTGARSDEVGGVKVPETTKAKGVLTQEFIQHQTPGQSVDDIINMLPGVSFQNNDPFGSAGGTLTIRGFDSSRISQTFDGVPLNDTGNYAIYSSQQLDPELIEQVNVNYGATDIDSPTASASGSTVNYRTIVPTDEFGARLQGSLGNYGFYRVFGLVNTGAFTSFGTKAFLAASHAENDNVFGHRGRVNKNQYNARVYQPIGSNGDFISIAGHYNVSRNNFFGSLPLRLDADRDVGQGSGDRFPRNMDEAKSYSVAACQLDTPQTGVDDATNTCGTTFSERFNPSNTGNIRVQSRFTLADNLVLSVEPSFQYVKANGGGTVTGKEQGYELPDGRTIFGYIGNTYYTGIDLNHDGDTLDGPGGRFNGVTLIAPSQTVTHRYGLISSLRYDINDAHSVRVIYTHDYGRHRQTGELGYVKANGVPFDVFPINDPILARDGQPVEKRNRKSFAILDEVAGEYSGRFFDDALLVNAGLAAKFFKRELNQYCFTTSASGFVDCIGNDPADIAAYAAANPGYVAPVSRTYHYNELTPSAGFTYSFSNAFSIFANYSKGLQVPGTDPLYASLFFLDEAGARPVPETTNNFDGGLRYTTSKIQAQIAPWYTKFNNRLASAYDPLLDKTIYRNLGTVEKYGIDASVAYQPIPPVLLYLFGSYLHSEIKNDVQLGTDAAGNPTFAETAGKRESGAPVYTLGGRAQYDAGPVLLGIQAKRTGKRYVNDQNTPIFQTIGGERVAVYGATAPAYTIVDIDAKVSLEWAGLNEKTFLQLNVTNVFNEFYVGGFGGDLSNTSVPFAQIGAPRAYIATLNFEI
jgi:iron complex outermembrane receptor protein